MPNNIYSSQVIEFITRYVPVEIPFSVLKTLGGDAISGGQFTITPSVYGIYTIPFTNNTGKIMFKTESIFPEGANSASVSMQLSFSMYKSAMISTARSEGKFFHEAVAEYGDELQIPYRGIEVFIVYQGAEIRVATLIVKVPEITGYKFLTNASGERAVQLLGNWFGGATASLEYKSNGIVRVVSLAKVSNTSFFDEDNNIFNPNEYGNGIGSRIAVRVPNNIPPSEGGLHGILINSGFGLADIMLQL